MEIAILGVKHELIQAQQRKEGLELTLSELKPHVVFLSQKRPMSLARSPRPPSKPSPSR